MKTRLILVLSILFLIIFINFSSALTVTSNPTSLLTTLKQGESKQLTLTFNFDNQDNSTNKNVILSLNNPAGLTVTSSDSSILIPAGSSSKTITLTISASSTTSKGFYNLGNIIIHDKLVPLSVDLQENLVGQCRIYTLPIPLTRILEAGSTSSQTIEVYVSKDCKDRLLIITNDQTNKPILFSIIRGDVYPSQGASITVTYDARDVQTGTYTSNLIVTASNQDILDNPLSLTLPISLTITGSISPTTNGSFDVMPTCSLSANELKLNETGKLICQSVNPNLKIYPIIDNSFIQGVSVEETANSYTYIFKPIKYGLTSILAKFMYKNAPIGGDYNQTLRVMAGSGSIAGTVLDVRFYPELYEVKDKVIIRAIDNVSGNILSNAKILVDGIEINGTTNLQSGKEYELRISHDGYNDLVKKININQKPILFNLSSNYRVGDELNFVTDPEGAVISLNEKVITLPFKLDTEGNLEISASLIGYTTTTKNITVKKNAQLLYSTDQNNLGKGKEILVEFEKSDTKIYVTYQKDTSSSYETLIPEFSGKEVRFIAKEYGIYNVYGDGLNVKSFIIEEKKFYKTWWGITIISLVVLLLIILVIRKINSKSSSSSSPSMFMESAR